MATDVPTAAEAGVMPVMVGTVTVKGTALLATPPLVVTTTLPLVAPKGTVTTMELDPHVNNVAWVPLKVILPAVAPNPDPEMVTVELMEFDEGDTEVIVGPVVTVNDTALLVALPTLTVTLPVVAPVGTCTTIEVLVHVVNVVAAVVLNLTELEPRVLPKPEPVMVTLLPTAPEVGDSDVILGPDAYAAVVIRHTTRQRARPEERKLRTEP